jgi:23S rRNA pseudouridine2605 synthase
MDHDPAEKPGTERIAKYLSRAGVCSRREAERWIANGRIKLNGATLTTPATLVGAGDLVLVDNAPVAAKEPTRVYRYYKPTGLVTSHADEKGRKTIFDALPPQLQQAKTVGRLDLNSEGLLLLTNDGAVKRHLELPATGWERRYRVRAFGIVHPNQLENLRRGVVVEGVRYGPIEAAVERHQGSNSWLIVTLKEGKNREIRRVFDSIGLTVNRLIRVGYGPFQLGKLPEGAVEEIPARILKQTLGALFEE